MVVFQAVFPVRIAPENPIGSPIESVAFGVALALIGAGLRPDPSDRLVRSAFGALMRARRLQSAAAKSQSRFRP